MDMFKDKETGTYHVRFKGVDGKSHIRSTKASNLEQAKKVVDEARILELEIAAKAGALNAESLTAIMAGRKVTCEEAVAEWSKWRLGNSSPNTVRTQTITLCAFLDNIGGNKWAVNRLTYDHLDAFVNAKDGGKVANRSLRVAALRSFFDFLSAKAYYVGNPSKLLRIKMNDLSIEQKETVKRVPFTKAEFDHIMKHAVGFQKWATALSYWAGLRLSDVACLEWASILPDELIVWTRKAERRVALNLDDPLIGGGTLRLTILELLEYNRHPQYVFPDERDTILDPQSRSKLSVYYGRLLIDLGIEGKSFHCLRHSFATRLAKSGKTLEEIGRLIGHRSTEVTKGYVHR